MTITVLGLPKQCALIDTVKIYKIGLLGHKYVKDRRSWTKSFRRWPNFPLFFNFFVIKRNVEYFQMELSISVVSNDIVESI